MRRTGDSFIDFLLKPVGLLNELLDFVLFGHRYLYFGIGGKKPILKFKTQEEHVKELQQELNGIVFHAGKFQQEIEDVLKQCRECDFIIFSSGKSFIQFALNTGEFIFDYPMLPANGLEKYRSQVLGLLTKMGFTRNRSLTEVRFLGFYYSSQLKFIIAKGKDWPESIEANFRRDSCLTAKFTATVFKKFFEVKPIKVDVIVG